MKAFKPKKSIFMHICQNCENGRPVRGANGSPLGYICLLKDNTHKLFGTHECDTEYSDEDQINCFDEIKEEE